MSVRFTAREIAANYDRFARWYDWGEGILGLLGLSSLRRSVLQQASGKVLEVAVGTGKNLYYYRIDCQITALDLSKEMLKVARARAKELNIIVHFSLADAEALPFPNHRFDTVVSSLSTCTFPNPAAALQEMFRVCKPGGQILLLEHGRSDLGWLGRWQDRHADKFAEAFGCHWNREPLDLVRQTGLKIKVGRRLFFGIFYQIEAAPEAR